MINNFKIPEGLKKERLFTLRCNTIKNNPNNIEEIFKKNNIIYNKIPWYEDAFIILNKKEEDLKELSIYNNGEIYFQSLSSMIPPLVLEPKENELILDMTASPGSKTTEICALSNNKALVTAVEKNDIRYKRLLYNIEKQGCKRVTIIKKDALKLDDNFKFDKILLDAPCTGSGTKNYKNITEELLNRCINTQKKLIIKAFNLLNKNGTLVYSTCSILKEENEEIINYLLNNFKNAKIEKINNQDFLNIEPNELYEGFFIAKIKKI